MSRYMLGVSKQWEYGKFLVPILTNKIPPENIVTRKLGKDKAGS